MIRYLWPAVGVVLVTLFAGAWLWHGSALRAADKAGYDRATDEMATQIAIANAKTDTLDLATRMESNKAAVAWESTRNELQTQITGLLTRPDPEPIRLCKPAPSPHPVPGTAANTAGPVDTPGGLEPVVRAGPDIRGPIIVFGGHCEADRLKLIQLLGLIARQSAERDARSR